MDCKKIKRFFIQEHLHRENVYHGGVGNVDIERILISDGYIPIVFPFHFDFSIKAKFCRFLYFLQTVLTLPSDALVVFQAPLYARMNILFIQVLVKIRKSIKVICFITDINGLKDGDEEVLQQEQRFFKLFHYFIVHNSAMQNWLLCFHPKSRIAVLEFFDFLAEPFADKRSKSLNIAFAGYLDKSRFVLNLQKLREIRFHLYGPTNLPLNVTGLDEFYHGVFRPSELTRVIKGAFGLVWDGDSIDRLSGTFGDYNKIISPHKLSLYILSGLPVIAHTSSGSAEQIKRYGIGLTVNSLGEVKEIILSLSDEAYEEMHQNCLQLAGKVSTGFFLRNALAPFLI